MAIKLGHERNWFLDMITSNNFKGEQVLFYSPHDETGEDGFWIRRRVNEVSWGTYSLAGPSVTDGLFQELGSSEFSSVAVAKAHIFSHVGFHVNASQYGEASPPQY
jgi:hypothetical protein